MKAKDIHNVLDLAWTARQKGYKFTPLFSGEAGLGKSEICQAWVAEKRKTNPDFWFYDLRLALLEAPDLVGLVQIVTNDADEQRTSHILPEFWPTQGEGLLLIEEPNRAQQSVLNGIMQLLTDRKIGKYRLPDGIMMAAAINPDQGYDVNTMDTALKDRFEMYEISYDHASFVEYIEAAKWHPNVINFVKSGIWLYKKSNEISEDVGGKYISPRTLSKLNTAEQCDLVENPHLHFETSISILGKNVGNEYYKFTFDNAPVLVKDILENKEAAYKKLAKYADLTNLRGDLLGVTVDSVIEGVINKQVGDDVVVDMADILPAEHVNALFKGLIVKTKSEYSVVLARLTKEHPAVKKAVKTIQVSNEKPKSSDTKTK